PAPGSIAPAGTDTPPALVSEYGVLGARQRPSDKLRPAQIRGLSASGVVMSGIRLLAVTPSPSDVRLIPAQVYLVPAEHYLTPRLAPDRCPRPTERTADPRLARHLRWEYTQHALCLLILRAGRSTSTCRRAPATVAPLKSGPSNPGYGLVPDGVSSVLVHYISHPSLSIAVHRNFWFVNVDWTPSAAPCGLDWLERVTVVRTVKACRKFVDTT